MDLTVEGVEGAAVDTDSVAFEVEDTLAVDGVAAFDLGVRSAFEVLGVDALFGGAC